MHAHDLKTGSRSVDFGTQTPTPGVASLTAFGSWAAFPNSSSFACEALCVTMKGFTSFGACMVFQIGIGTPATIIGNLLLTESFVTGSGAITGQQWYLPVHIPAGATVSIRVAATTSGTLPSFQLHGFSNGLVGAPGFSRALALETQGTTTPGLLITSGGANAKGSWTQVVASTPYDIAALAISVTKEQTGTDPPSTTRYLLDVGIGTGGSEQVIIPDWLMINGAKTVTAIGNHPVIPIPVQIPKGTRVAARLQASAASQKLGFSFMGLAA